MLLRASFFSLWVVIGAQVYSQDFFCELPEVFPAATTLVKASSGLVDIRTYLKVNGDIVIVAEIKNVKTSASWHTSLPMETKVDDWTVEFVVVPKLSLLEIETIRRQVDERVPADKLNQGRRQALSRSIPDFFSDTHAYKIKPSLRIPVEEADRMKVNAFITALSKIFRSADGQDIAEMLKWKLMR